MKVTRHSDRVFVVRPVTRQISGQDVVDEASLGEPPRRARDRRFINLARRRRFQHRDKTLCGISHGGEVHVWICCIDVS